MNLLVQVVNKIYNFNVYKVISKFIIIIYIFYDFEIKKISKYKNINNISI